MKATYSNIFDCFCFSYVLVFIIYTFKKLFSSMKGNSYKKHFIEKNVDDLKKNYLGTEM